VTSVSAALPDGVRVILCIKFAPRAPFQETSKMKAALVQDPRVLQAAEVSGTYDFMFEVQCPDGAAYQRIFDEFAGRYGHVVERYEASFICRRYFRTRDTMPHCLWVPIDEGTQRIDHSQIDRVTAEGDYVRIHSGESSWLLHSTMNRISERLGRDGFLRLNRSEIVRPDVIARVVHDLRSWAVVLTDGSRHKIAKSRSVEVLRALRCESSTGGADSPVSGVTQRKVAATARKSHDQKATAED
jgi:hypothetical protein